MLPEKIVEELVRNTELSKELVLMAWPSLSTESKLQVICAYHLQSGSPSTPDWLAQIALDDDSALVKYWAARYTYFNTNPADAKLFPASEDDQRLYIKAARDESPLVRFCTEKHQLLFSFENLNELPQTSRLLAIRHLDYPSLSTFTQWLESAINKKIPDHELRDCAQEFFMHPSVKKEMARTPSDFNDGFDAYQSRKGMEKGWEVVRKAERGLRIVLSCYLPTSSGMGSMNIEDLTTLPDEALSMLIYQMPTSKEVDSLKNLIRNHPEKFSESIQKDLKQFDEQNLSTSDIENQKKLKSVTPQEVMLQEILNLKTEIVRMQDDIREVISETSKKRGFFS